MFIDEKLAVLCTLSPTHYMLPCCFGIYGVYNTTSFVRYDARRAQWEFREVV